MSFQVPRRQNFPRPLGDNSPYTPPDPGPVLPPYKPPDWRDYQAARMRWEDSGDLEALWEMQDNVSLAWPRDIPAESTALTPSITKPAPEPVPVKTLSLGRRLAVAAFLVVAILNFLVAVGVLR